MKYAHIKENGQLLGWYDNNTHTSIPTPNIEVTDEQWQIALDNNHNKVNQDGTTELYDFRIPSEVLKQELKTKLGEAQALLDSTQFKFGDDYDQKNTAEWLELKARRQEARDFIRANDVPNT